ncbi:restriction endonuclease subunit S [Sphingomonas qilianensis]|uniref:Restriction endonuclease subunit S n=1 Tax=Sphingomonas qilianensis TaxID=1736690 RepID=A0ABU9XT23_9SPHN
MVKLNSVFNVEYGSKLDLNKMLLVDKAGGGVNFVGRSSVHHGVSATVARLFDKEPYPAGSLTVALGGTKLLASFVQLEEFYTAQNVAVLTPLVELTLAQKLYVCLAIRHNRFRYSAFGREANRTLRTLEIPAVADFPAWIGSVSADLDVSKYQASASGSKIVEISTVGWSLYRLDNLFEIKKGLRLTQSKMTDGEIPFVSAIDKNNGIRQKIGAAAKHLGNLITVSYNGSVGEAFYQPTPFFASDDVNVLYPKFKLTENIGLFLCAIIRKEAFRFSYGRKWTAERMRATEILLPSVGGLPDWLWIEEFMSSVPGSAALVPDVIDAQLLSLANA